MIWLSNSTISRLRDQLRARGQRPSVVVGDPTKISVEAAELMGVAAEYGPICEAMYLMMSADGKISNEERSVLKGALRSISNESLASTYIEAMVDAAAKNVALSGREKRLADVAAQLQDDPQRGEVAFVLAAAVAFADGAIADEENETLSDLAEKLGIDDARVEALLDAVETDVAKRPASTS
jgi:tellurite resistance protein